VAERNMKKILGRREDWKIDDCLGLKEVKL